MNKNFDAIIVAAGSGKRMNMGINKQFLEIDSKPILAWTIGAFYNNANIDNIIITVREEDCRDVEILLKSYGYDNIHLVIGGKERQNSIDNALNYLKKLLEIKFNDVDYASRYIMIHDGARPFIDQKIIDATMLETINNNCVCVGVPSKDTIKIIDSKGNISSTPNRNFIWNAQTPQSFRLDIILDAYKKSNETGFLGTDDASLVENIGFKVKMLIGSYNNIKITTVEDLDFAEIIANKIKEK